ncbi:MAG: hypothetical protein V1799_04560 [bacterium]
MKRKLSIIFIGLTLWFVQECPSLPSILSLNTLSILGGSGIKNKRGIVQIELSNSQSITAIQFDITFPAVIRIEKDSVRLASRKRDHVITTSKLSSDTYRVISYSSSLKSYTGNSGAIIEIPVVLGDSTGVYPVSISNVILGDSTSTNVVTSYAGSNFTIRSSSTGLIQNIKLNQGWNMISSFLAPIDSSLDLVLGKIKQNLVIMKNGKGQVYWPSFAINTIGNWSYRQAYQMYMSAKDSLTIDVDTLATAQRCISLTSGWNYIAYLDTVARSPAEVFGDCLSKLVILKENSGKIFWPKFSINTLGSMNPGQGYIVYMTDPCIICFP